jgi:hypothetical protein
MPRFVFAAAATALLVLSGAAAADGQTAPDPTAALQFLAGHWSCTSVADGKKSVYTTDWAAVPGGHWMRGTNRSGASQSEDLLEYDARQKRWRTVDLEPDGSMSVLVSPVDADPANMPTQSVYPDDSQSVRFEKRSDAAYVLTFDFYSNGKHARWEDDCTRS